MAERYERSLDDLIEVLKRATKEKTRINLLIGAGASVTGKIPLANTIIQDIKKKFPREYEKAEKKTYAECMATLTSLERRKLISDYVDNSKVNWTHLLIAHLMKNNVINSVLTTNFDNLLIRACALENSIPGVYDLAASNSFRPELLYEKSIIHLHGQYTGFVLCNTESELENQIKKIEPTFIEMNKNSMWIVVGYSGENDPIVKLFKKYKNSDNRLYWIGYKDSDPNEDVKELLEEKEKHCYYIKGYDSDSFFVNLCRGLEKYPPDLINAPFTYLYSTIDTITEYIEDDIPFVNAESYNNMTKDIVKKAINEYEHNNVIMAEYYYRLNLIEEFKQVREKASEEEKIEIDKITEKYKFKDLTNGALNYLDELINGKTEFNIKNLELANIIITFLDDDIRETALDKINIILNDKSNDDESIIELRIAVLMGLYSYKKSISLLEKILEIIEESNMKDNDLKGYLTVKIDVYRKLGKHKLLNEKDKALEYLDKAIKIIDENEETLTDVFFDVIKGEIYINKIECSDKNYIYMGIVLDSFNKAISEYCNDDIKIDHKFRLISFIKELYTFAVSYSDSPLSEIIFEEMKKRLKNISSTNIILSYLEASNRVLESISKKLDDIENIKDYDKFLENFYNIIINFEINTIDEKEKYDISIQINQFSYNLIDILENKYSKFLLEISKKICTNAFNIATTGFYELKVNNNLELGAKFYDEAIEKENDPITKQAIKQKKGIEIAKLNIYLGNISEAVLVIEAVLKLGIVSEGWDYLYNEALDIKEYLDKSIQEIAVDIKEIELDKN